VTVMVIEIYDALRSAGAEEAKARKAAEAMMREERFDQIDKRFDRVDSRFENVENRLTRVEARLDMVTWMLGISLTLSGGVFTGTILLLLRAFPVGGN